MYFVTEGKTLVVIMEAFKEKGQKARMCFTQLMYGLLKI